MKRARPEYPPVTRWRLLAAYRRLLDQALRHPSAAVRSLATAKANEAAAELNAWHEAAP